MRPGLKGFFLGIASATWEADVWGRIRRTNEAARAQYLATEEARRGVMLTLASDVSQALLRASRTTASTDIARETTQSYTATLKVFSDRLQEGLGNALQTSRATADLATSAASVQDLERLIALKENQISVLMGKNPGTIETKIKLLEETRSAHGPCRLAFRVDGARGRISLAAAERVRYANARIGVAKSAYFPRIGLTTFFGKLSTPLEDLTSGNTNAWSLAANASGPIFRGGALRAQRRQAVASWEEAKAQYMQTALSAFRDVADALISREKYDTVRAGVDPRCDRRPRKPSGLARTRATWRGCPTITKSSRPSSDSILPNLLSPRLRSTGGWWLSNSTRRWAEDGT